MDRDLRYFFIKFGHANVHNYIYLQLYIFVISLTILSYLYFPTYLCKYDIL